ncbi:MAG: GAF domain-containing protein, partial [Treponema sp.]|nr:GAF domain-containing protein [Treponema sp.]
MKSKPLNFDKLQALININSRINSSYSDVNALLVYILEAAMCLVDCESSSLLLVNREDSMLRFVVALGPKGAEAKNIPVDMNSIAGWVVQSNKPVIVNNVASDLRFNNTVQKKTGYVTRTMAAIPMRVKGKCIGVIEVINKAGTQGFDDSDLQVLTLLSDQAAIAYSNADDYRSAQDKISVLQERIENGAQYHSFVAKSPAAMDLLRIIEQIAVTNSSVLITGESGVGKELFAEQLHLKSHRVDKPFI